MLKGRIKDIYLHRHILWDMTSSQFKAKYAGSKLGIWWAVLTPLILAICINRIFTVAFTVNIPNYTLFVLAGIIPWLFFANATSEATTSFTVNSSILRQGIFPREFIPISSVLSNLLNFFIGFVFLLPFFIILNFRVTGLLLFLLMIIILQSLFIVGLGLLFSSVNVFFRDLTHFLSIGLMIWFWITPVFYSLDMLPFPFRWVCLLNPMTYYVISYKQILFEARAPSLLTIFISFSISLGFLVMGYLFFIKKEPALLKRI